MRIASSLVLASATLLGADCGTGFGIVTSDAGDAPPSAPPLPGDAGVLPSLSVAVGLFFTCVLMPDRTIECWGYNAYGMLGNGTMEDSVTPVKVSNVSGVLGLAAAGYEACALLPSEKVECWGDNFGGGLGVTTLTDSDVPFEVPDVGDAIQVSVGTGFACALLSNRTAKCWGANSLGAAGNGSLGGSPYFQAPPGPVVDLTNATTLSSGHGQTCALLVDGSLRCWGSNASGELGTGTLFASSPAPLAVAGLGNVRSIAAGTFVTCALLDDGTVACWGDNNYGELGNGQIAKGQPGTPTPAKVPGLTGVTAISAGDEYVCAVLADRTAACWGRNDLGTLGNGTTTASPIPVPVSNLTDVVGIVAGSTHVCAQRADGTLACWGNNQYGQLGDGTKTSSAVPVAVKL